MRKKRQDGDFGESLWDVTAEMRQYYIAVVQYINDFTIENGYEQKI